MTYAVFAIPGAVPAITLKWVRWYCMGMSDEARDRRSLEIESDLWEHFADGQADGKSPAALNVEMLSRLLRGIPSDIAWRFQAEGFHVNIQFPLERVIGVLLLFLLVPFFAGSALSGYDTRIGEWPDAFRTYADMSATGREVTGYLHSLVGVLVVVGVSQLLVHGVRRSPGLIAAAAAFLAVGGVIMVVNGGVYFGMSALAEDFNRSGDPGIIATARGYARAIEILAVMNLGVMSAGIVTLSVAVTRLGFLPRWMNALAGVGGVAAVISFGSVFASDGYSWAFLMVAWLSLSLWLLIGGLWLLLGGSRRPEPLISEPAPA